MSDVPVIPAGIANLADRLAAWRTILNANNARIDSHEAAWASWTPTFTNLTVGNGTLVARYLAIGKTVHYRLSLVLGSTSVIGTSPRFTLPVAPASISAVPLGDIDLTDTGTANRRGIARLTTGSTVEIVGYGTTGVAVSVTATVPHTWAATDTIGIIGMYEST